MDLQNADSNKLEKKQERLLYWSLAGFSLFLISMTASSFRHLLGFDPHVAGHNFTFNIIFLFPATLLALLILFITGGLTIIYWNKLASLKKKILIILMSYSVIFYVAYGLIRLLQQP